MRLFANVFSAYRRLVGQIITRNFGIGCTNITAPLTGIAFAKSPVLFEQKKLGD